MAPIRWRSWRHVALLGAKIGALDWRQWRQPWRQWRQFLGANGALLVSTNVDWRHVALRGAIGAIGAIGANTFLDWRHWRQPWRQPWRQFIVYCYSYSPDHSRTQSPFYV